MQVDTIQLVWTHDCEHGVINGFDLSPDCSDGVVRLGSRFAITSDYLQIGPEQILARIPCSRDAGAEEVLLAQVDCFDPDVEMMQI